MTITTLVENLTYKQYLQAEHGLAFYLETKSKKILFDTGQSSMLLHNAHVLGIDLSQVDVVVISHGHYDHTGGLYPFLQINTKARVFIKKDAFKRKYHGQKRFIGIPFDQSMLENRVEFVSEITQIDDQLFIMPHIPIKYGEDTHFKNFKIAYPGGFIDDDFSDELFLAYTGNQTISIITSCSHRGITNIIDAAKEAFQHPFNLILGGFHIKESEACQINHIADNLITLAPAQLGMCHCTGVEKYAQMKHLLGPKVFYNHTGMVIHL
jgi:7,8-dihydropterin-6-yl-methyl-4-(beta-D-ribofuranosyl)aminobenzene 5'-phosphate synthase